MSSSAEHTPAPHAAPHVPAEEQIRQQAYDKAVADKWGQLQARTQRRGVSRDTWKYVDVRSGCHSISHSAMLPARSLPLRRTVTFKRGHGKSLDHIDESAHVFGVIPPEGHELAVILNDGMGNLQAFTPFFRVHSRVTPQSGEIFQVPDYL